jgi:hypothetical protein
VGGHHRQAGFTSQPQRGLYHAFHLRIVHALDFQIKAVGKQAFPVLRPAHGFFALAHGQCHPDIAQMRTGQAQQIAVVTCSSQARLISARPRYWLWVKAWVSSSHSLR